MRKQVTFVEQLKKEKLLRNGGGSMTHHLEPAKRCTEGFEHLPSQQKRDIRRGTLMNVPAGSQHMGKVHIPKSIMSAPFLQHPALTAGQRRYLCSIASVYSTQHMRHQMKQHYLNVLRTCIQSGQIPTCTKRYGNELRETRALSRDSQKKDVARAKPPGQRLGNSSAANSDVILPKIVNR